MFSEARVVPLEEMFNEFASVGMIKEGNQRDNVPSGSYRLQVTKWEAREVEESNGGKRKFAHLTVTCTDKDGKRRGTIFPNVSWQTRRNEFDGKPDKQSRLYSQLAKAVFPTLTDIEIADKAVPTVMDTAMLYPVEGYVSERFKDSEGNWYSAKTAEDAKAYREKGYDAISILNNFSKAK